ncbi:MAG: hypothetical protein LUG52_03610 [Clostridia bacterium]|nr:hypothetical protein [Clostridia bacterium]
MSEKIRAYLLTAVFVLFLAAISIAFFVIKDSDYSETEKRYLQQSPAFSAESVLSGDFTSELEEYAQDQFPARNFFKGLSAYFDLLCGRNCAEDIYFAKEGYLINAPDEDDGETFEKNLSRFDNFAESLGIESKLVIIPSTGYILNSYLPAFHAEYEDDKYFAEAEETLKNITLIDTRDALKDANEEKAVCYKTDHHLTSWGNYTVYKKILEELLLEAPEPEDYTIETYSGFYGTTYSSSGYFLAKGDDIEIWDKGLDVSVTISDAGAEEETYDTMFFKDHLDELDKYPVFLDGNHSVVKIENSAAKGGKLLILRDSYAHCLAPFLAENYSEIYLIDMRYYRSSVSQFAEENGVDSLLIVYGLDSMLTDNNAAWLE